MNGSFNAAFGDYIHTLRENKRVARSDLAKHLDLTLQNVDALENGEYPIDVTIAAKLAQFFDIPVSRLFSGAHITARSDDERPTPVEFRILVFDLPIFDSKRPVSDAEMSEVVTGYNSIPDTKSRLAVRNLIEQLSDSKPESRVV